MGKHDTSVTRSVKIGENDTAIFGWKGDSFGGGRYLRKEQSRKGGNERTHRLTVPLLW